MAEPYTRMPNGVMRRTDGEEPLCCELHRPIDIDAHLKGDLEKPFRPPRQKLYVVAR